MSAGGERSTRRCRAAILAIGDEIVLGQQPDTNSRWIAEALAAAGVMATEFRTVGDDRAAIRDAFSALTATSDIVVSTGGLGPTADDLTRHALNDLLSPDEKLVVDERGVRWLEAWFRGRARPMPEINLLQAMRPRDAALLENRRGTAPGLAAESDACRIFCLPGPPREMQPMFEAFVAPAAGAIAGGRVLRMAVVRQIGLGESEAAERLGALMERSVNPLVGTTASGGIVSARIRAEGEPNEAARLCSAAMASVRFAWAPYAYGEGETTLAEALHALLRGTGETPSTVATAESCTGGLLASMLVEPAGASELVRGGWVTYTNEMKVSELGVDPALIATHGAVSEPVVRAMAAGAVVRAGATFSLAISGIAGPSGGTPAKPVGTVWIALADARTLPLRTDARCFRIGGSRDDIRDRSARLALQMLRLHILGESARPLLWQLEARGSGIDGPADSGVNS